MRQVPRSILGSGAPVMSAGLCQIFTSHCPQRQNTKRLRQMFAASCLLDRLAYQFPAFLRECAES